MSVELTKEQLDALQNAEGTISLIETEINKAESAGLDVAGLRKQLDEVKKVREGLLRVYGGRTITRRVF